MPDDVGAGDQVSEAIVRSALSALTRKEWRILYLYANKLLNPNRIFSEGREGKDLVHDAVIRAFGHWNASKGKILDYLYGAVRSGAGHLSERYHGNAAEVPLSESNQPGGGGEFGTEELLDRQVCDQPGPDKTAYWNEVLSRAEFALKDDPEALQVLHLVADHAGNSKRGPTIQRKLGITAKDFRARMTRLRRTFYKTFPEGV